MRLVIKPLGAIIILLAITALTVLSILNYQRRAMLSSFLQGDRAGVLLQTFSAASWRLNNELADASLLVKTDPNAPGVNNSVLHAKVRKAHPDRPYLVRASKSVPQALAANQQVEMRLWGRSRTSGTVHVYFEEGHPPYTKDLDRKVQLTPNWKEYRFNIETNRDYAPGEAQVRLAMGGSAGEFDFSGLELSDAEAAKDEL